MNYRKKIVVAVQLPSLVWLFLTLWTVAYQASLSVIISQSFLKVVSIELVMPSNHLILCYPLLLLPSIFPSIRVFSSESALCIRWPKDWSFSFSINISMNIQGWFLLQSTYLISFQSKGLSRVFSNTTIQKHLFFSTHPALTSAQDYWKNRRFDYTDLCWQTGKNRSTKINYQDIRSAK